MANHKPRCDRRAIQITATNASSAATMQMTTASRWNQRSAPRNTKAMQAYPASNTNALTIASLFTRFDSSATRIPVSVILVPRTITHPLVPAQR